MTFDDIIKDKKEGEDERLTSMIKEALEVATKESPELTEEQKQEILSYGTVCEREVEDPFANTRINLDEGSDVFQSQIKPEWFGKSVHTVDELKTFIEHLTNDYNHDYGTIVHALAAAAVQAARVVDNDPSQGGITGFQASAVMWEFISNWMHYKGPMRMLQYEHMLYPQYDHIFTKISGDTWEWLQKEAQVKLNEAYAIKDMKGNVPWHPDVVAHLELIVAGKVPFGYTIEND